MNANNIYRRRGMFGAADPTADKSMPPSAAVDAMTPAQKEETAKALTDNEAKLIAKAGPMFAAVMQQALNMMQQNPQLVGSALALVEGAPFLPQPLKQQIALIVGTQQTKQKGGKASAESTESAIPWGWVYVGVAALAVVGGGLAYVNRRKRRAA